MALPKTVEHQRLTNSESRHADWKNWGPYLSERAWGTVREDYSAEGAAWDHFPHDHARSRAYRWNEDGLGGFCNRRQNICMGLALWNEADPILKERLFGLTGNQGNHAEDVKEYYYYLDSTPTHSYAKLLYKYPQTAYPYAELEAENRRRSRHEPEYELVDALFDVFKTGRYFDVFIEYAKADQDDILCRISVINRGPAPAPIHVLPQIWFRNDWSWGYGRERSTWHLVDPPRVGIHAAYADHRHLGERWWYVDVDGWGNVPLLFTENETNKQRLWNTANDGPYVKDGFDDAVVHGRIDRVNPAGHGSKVAAHFQSIVRPGATLTVRVRLTNVPCQDPFGDFDVLFDLRIREADEFYTAVQNPNLGEDERRIQRQAFAGLLWSKQFYHYSVELWLEGDPAGPPPPAARRNGRNAQWGHLHNFDVISVPDKWEYPWYAAWDLAFHMIPMALIDPEWAKRQIILMLREWYMHPNGQIPAYEWGFGDVNPPVHAWAAWRVYKITRKETGKADTAFLERVFHKLLLNFTWWINRKDAHGRNVFQGGFLGLDNIGVFDRSAPLPTGGHLEQADGTAWMGMYCLNMLAMALELARTRPAYEDIATKFFEHFIYIANAINGLFDADGLWDEQDGFYYDMIDMTHASDEQRIALKVRSFVGLIPLFAVETLDPDILEMLPHFRRRMEWFIRFRPNLIRHVAALTMPGQGGRSLLSLVNREQLKRIMARMLDPDQFLSAYGLRSVSKEHRQHPYVLSVDGQTHTVTYEPGESSGTLFGGNSNWRGPIWFPLNYLVIESLQKYHHYYGRSLSVELPVGSGQYATLDEVATDLSRRLIHIFRCDTNGRRAYNGTVDIFQNDPCWRDNILFYEYFHGDNGRGIGASHQTGWTALVAKLIQQTRDKT